MENMNQFARKAGSADQSGCPVSFPDPNPPDQIGTATYALPAGKASHVQREAAMACSVWLVHYGLFTEKLIWFEAGKATAETPIPRRPRG
jgi:hypothetical protein